MRAMIASLALALVCGAVARAQTPVPSPPASGGAQFETISLGETMQAVRDRLGDPVQVVNAGGHTIWRYLAYNNAVFLDVLVKDNVAYSVTVVRRYPDSAYAGPRGVSFGMADADVRAAFGPPDRTTTNADDGSVDYWYRVPEGTWVYEFYNGKLGFIQLVAPHGIQEPFKPGPPIAPADGTSLDRAIEIRPARPLANALWINAFLQLNQCGNGGSWKQTSATMKEDDATHDPNAFTVVHAKCTDGDTERDFFFDTRAKVASAP